MRRTRTWLWILAAALLLAVTILVLRPSFVGGPEPITLPAEAISLPAPRQDGAMSLEMALQHRRSERDFSNAPLTLDEVSQLLWAAQGITDPRGYRTAPSAGALYPLELYLLVRRVEGLPIGVFRYQPSGHALIPWLSDDAADQLTAAAVGQSCIRDAAANLVFTAVYERTRARYGYRATQYVHMEAGHASQNVYLQAAALDLGTVAIGAFEDARVKDILALPAGEEPVYIMPVGRPRPTSR